MRFNEVPVAISKDMAPRSSASPGQLSFVEQHLCLPPRLFVFQRKTSRVGVEKRRADFIVQLMPENGSRRLLLRFLSVCRRNETDREKRNEPEYFST